MKKRGKECADHERLLFGLVALSVLSLPSSGCRQKRTPGLAVIRMATTTSTQNSGLLDRLLPPFEKRYGCRVDVIAVGTGKALELGRRGDVDLVMVHDRARELPFVSKGFGQCRIEFMWNDFVLLGPPSDPAGAKKVATVLDALAAVARSKALYLSRDDGSGTNARATLLQSRAGVTFDPARHLRVGLGMAAALTMASEKGAYVLSDRGTFVAMQTRLRLEVVSRQDKILHNVYSVIAVNPVLHPKVNHVGAMALIGYVTGPEGQRRIARYRMKGQALFHPLLLPRPGAR
ncbi:MAG: substrate-binding domain-containing protein [Deltaproteobacteria bacterium]|nr:substrate-binding domain-containing protein [Deltaproteobacteria bacterium]